MAKVFIDMPPFSKKSNGVVCFYELYEFLFKKNIDVYYLPRDVFEIKYNVDSIPYDLTKYNFKLSLEGSNKNDWLIANDTTSKKHIKIARERGLKILWWQLAPYNFLGRKVFPKVGEINLPFSSCVDPHAKNFFYYQPPIDKYWKYALELCNNEQLKKDSITFYTGKGRVKDLPIEIKKLFRKYNINLISRTYPNTRNGVFKLLLNSIAFITFDELTQLNLEAASIGLPVFVVNKIFPEFVYNKFPVKSLGERLTGDPEYFLELIEKSKNKQLTKFKIRDLIQNNENTFDYIYKVLTQNNTALKIGSEDLQRFNSWTSFLRSKNMIHPHLNGGQSGGSLFIKKYCSNLIEQKNSYFVNKKIFIFEEICNFLYNLKILPVLEYISKKSLFLFSKTKIPRIFHILKIFFKYKIFKSYDYAFFQNNSNRWQNQKITLDQILNNYNKMGNIYDDVISQNNLTKSLRIKYIVFSKKQSNKNKLNSIQRLFQNSFISFKDTEKLKIKYKQFDSDI